MERFRPKTISTEIWQMSEHSTEWVSASSPHEMRVLECVKYTVCCHISDMHLHNGLPRYILLTWCPKEVVDSIMRQNQMVFARPNIPDMLDLKTKLGLYVKIYTNEDQPKDYDSAPNEMILRMTTTGRFSPATLEYLDQSQSQDVRNFLVTFYNECLESNLYERITRVQNEEPVPFAVPLAVEALLLQDTDLDLIPNLEVSGTIPPVRGDRWSQMKTLPKLKTPVGKPAKWGAWLAGKEARFKVFDESTDQVVAARFLADYTDNVCVRESRATPKTIIETVLASLRAFSEGRPKRTKIQEDLQAFGVGIKKRKNQDEEVKLKSSVDDWKRASFPMEEASEPEWVVEELEELERPTDMEWLTLEDNYIHTIVDEHATEAVNSYKDIVTKLWVSALIERMQVAATRAFNELHTDRAKVTTVPIITRKSWKTHSLSQLWGFVIIGPHHVKQETDRIPIVTVELISEDNPGKYPNHSHFKLLYHKGTDSVGHEDVLVRVTSIAKYKLFTFSTIRRVYIQPCSVFSKLILKQSAEKREKDFSLENRIEIMINGRPVLVTWRSWIIRVLCIEYLMAIHNNPQMEGFLANIRRLHMARHAMMEKSCVFLPFGSAPEDKCNECIINNPVVAFLARTWNELPNVYI
nr:polymerase subunit PA [Bourbon virus]